MVCSKCGEDKNAEDYYVDYNRAKPIPMQYCKACRSEINKIYREENADKIKEYQRAYREKLKLLPKYPISEEQKKYQKEYQKKYRLKKKAQ